MSEEMLSLMHGITEKKYAKSPPKKQLMRILHEIEIKKHYGRSRNWELMVEFLARWIVKHEDLTLGSMACLPFLGLPMKSDKDLYDHIDGKGLLKHFVVAAKAKPWDYIGEVYQDLNLVGLGQNMTPKGVVDMMAHMLLGYPKDLIARDQMRKWVNKQTAQYAIDYWNHHRDFARFLPKLPPPKLEKVLEPCVGTGRFLIEITTMYAEIPTFVLYGIEINLSLYRACLVNMALFSHHPYTILCADTLRLPQTCNCAHPIWDLGNRWKPPSLQKFYDWKPPKTSALQRFMQMQTEESKT